jgi:glycosyltransferase involved in cell wall biosynthesis
MKVVHLTSSRFFGGPERQMLGLADRLRGRVESVFISFAEGGLCRAFLDEAGKQGFEAQALTHDTPHLWASALELTSQIRQRNANLLLCHGYKADLLGLWAARKLRIPIVAVSRGWTAECPRVRLYEALDRRFLRWVDCVVCVSERQAEKVRSAGVPTDKIKLIHNAVRSERFAAPDPAFGERLRAIFPRPPRQIVGAAGRLSPEKGFDVLVDAAAVCAGRCDVGFVLFGDGPMRSALSARIAERGLADRFHVAGFTHELDRYFPHFDLFAQSSHTEGLPNVILESFAAGVPVVATAVGGTPELVADGKNGFLVPAGNAAALADGLRQLLENPPRRKLFGAAGRELVAQRFSFDSQARSYRRLFAVLLGKEAVSDGMPVEDYAWAEFRSAKPGRQVTGDWQTAPKP